MGLFSKKVQVEVSLTDPASSPNSSLESYRLAHPGGCSGMFWRKDPRGAKPQKGNPDWPKNGSVLNGEAHEIGGTRWLCVDSWKQNGQTKWYVNCEGLWMPFDQGGLLLHKL